MIEIPFWLFVLLVFFATFGMLMLSSTMGLLLSSWLENR